MRLLHRFIAQPWALLFTLFVFLLLCLARIGTLTFDGDINRAFYTDSPLSRAQSRFETQYATRPSDVALFLETTGALSETQFVAARTLALDLELTPGVAAVVSPFVLRFPPNHPDFADEPVVPATPLPRETRERLAAFAELETGLPMMIADRALLIVASVDTAARPLADTLAEMRALAEPVQSESLKVTITGPDVIGLEIGNGLQSDLLMLNLIGAALVAGAALLFLRDVRLALIGILPGVLGMVATLGVAAWLGISITVLNNVIPMLILVIGVANGLHLSVHLARADGAMATRVADTLRAVGPATALTAGTTALAFASIMVTSNQQLFEFSYLGALSMVVGLAFLLPGFAAIAMVLAPPRRDIGGGLARLASGIGARSVRAPRLVSLGCLGLLVASGVGFATTSAWFPLGRYLPSDSPLRGADTRIETQFNGIFRAWVEMPPDTDWAGYRAVVHAVEAVSPPGAVLSEVSLARWSGTEGAAPPPDALDRLPTTVAQRLTDPETGVRRFAVSVSEPMRSDRTLAAYDAIEAAAKRAGAARVIGTPAILRHGSVDLIHELSIGLLLASAGGAALVSLAFRSLALLPVVLFVNLLPVLIVGAAPHVLNQGHLTPPLTLALTIAFGIAVDDTIHLLTRFRQATRQGLAPCDALSDAVQRAGGVMTMTTLLLSIGLAVTFFSVFEPVRLFGATLILSLVAALLTDLVLLPALVMMGARRAAP